MDKTNTPNIADASTHPLGASPKSESDVEKDLERKKKEEPATNSGTLGPINT